MWIKVQFSLVIFCGTLLTFPYIALAASEKLFDGAAKGEYRAAFEYCRKNLALTDRLIQFVPTIATDEQKLSFINSISDGYRICLSLVHQYLRADAGYLKEGLEMVLRRKGVILDLHARARAEMQDHASESQRQDWSQFTSLLSDYSHMLLPKAEKMSRTDEEKLTLLQQKVEETERRIFNHKILTLPEIKQPAVTAQAVMSSLLPSAALVEFVKVQGYDFATSQWATSWRYLAFALTVSGEVALVDLGNAATIDTATQRMLQDLRNSLLPDPDLRAQSLRSLREFYAKVWAPLEKSLVGADRVMVSPDGALNLVPFAALVDSQGRFLLERYRLAYVSSGRELAGTEGMLFQPSRELLLVADPDYEHRFSATDPQAAPLRSRDSRQRFEPLSHTAQEAIDIPPLLGAKDLPRVGAHATEAAVKAARSPRIVHLATHGFFLPDTELALGEEKRGTRGSYENPLVRSGLALAGANHAAEITEGEDGILTALEVSGMDLHDGTELVVLSACDTGVGDIQNGEGVFGLRRAFALAGAKNLLMSLWPVESEITTAQMKLFYQNLRTMPPAIALREAQLETIKELKKKDGIALPVLWAPFILQGAHALGF